MLNLSAPTRRTFAVAISAIVLGILAWYDPLDFDLPTDVAFGLLTGGSVLLLLGNLFSRL